MSTAISNPSNGNAAASEKKTQSVRELLSSDVMRRQFALALPKHLTPERFARVALTALTKNPKLERCTQASLFSCLLTLSQLGLEPDGRRAHLIPFGAECTLVIDYKGLVELAIRSGLVSNIHADKVCANDEFEFDRGQVTRHKIDFRADDRGKPFAYYCIVRFKDGTEQACVMTVREVEAIRARSKAAGNGPWVTDFDEMAKKTVFKRLAKWITLSPEIRDAISVDDEAERVPIETTAVTTVIGESRSDQLAAILSGPAITEEATAYESAGEDSQASDSSAGEEPQTGSFAEDENALNMMTPEFDECETLAQAAKVEARFRGKSLSARQLGYLADKAAATRKRINDAKGK